MEYTGDLRKMRTEFGTPVNYYLNLGDEELHLNKLIGKSLKMEYKGEIHCIKCGRKTNKSFAQGYCYPCFTSAPETEECVLRPELCRAHEGIARDMDFAENHCLIEHVVYLSLTSDLKVGVTRNTQVPTRWIDQGALQAIELARTPNRYTAGLIEVTLKAHVKDKTNWRNMLKNVLQYEGSLVESKKEYLDLLPDDLQVYASPDDTIISLEYPVSSYPVKVSSLNLDKDPMVEGVLEGIKGQYFLFDGGRVINIRKYGGYKVSLNF